MTLTGARKWIILSSLAITGAQIIFLLTAPAFGFPVEYPKNLNLIQIVSPVFLGYLGSASHFIFQNPAPNVPVQSEFLGMLVKGPIIIYVLIVTAAFVVFGYTNRAGAEIGTGMSIDALGTSLALALGVLAATTGILTSYLFVSPKATAGESRDPGPQQAGP